MRRPTGGNDGKGMVEARASKGHHHDARQGQSHGLERGRGESGALSREGTAAGLHLRDSRARTLAGSAYACRSTLPTTVFHRSDC